MSKINDTNQPSESKDERTQVRRSDRQVHDEAWIQVFMQNAPVGTLATMQDGQPYVNTNLFAYDAETHSIIMHTARKGRTRTNIENTTEGTAQNDATNSQDSNATLHGKQVTFTIMEMGRLLPAPESLEFSVEYASVVVFGKAHVISDEQEGLQALQLIMDKYAPHLKAGHGDDSDYRPPVPEELKRTSVFRISIEAWTGKKKEVETHEGAYWYDERPMLKSVRQRPAWRGSVQAIQIAPEEGAPVKSVTSIEASAGRGLIGDRYCAPKPLSPEERTGTDVTLVAIEDVEALAEDGIHITPLDTRRNIVTQGVPLNYLVGKRFRLGNAILEGVLLCEPCATLGKYTGKGNRIVNSMLHRGGLRANVIRSGLIHTGDTIVPLEDVGA
jgi:nitroimidazol reductase NimA-like FMN-containing flavoprotein (pyridoxamine 5'-phosphate oxidase superfamily)/MOSC domain-containing protein YiiM